MSAVGNGLPSVDDIAWKCDDCQHEWQNRDSPVGPCPKCGSEAIDRLDDVS